MKTWSDCVKEAWGIGKTSRTDVKKKSRDPVA